MKPKFGDTQLIAQMQRENELLGHVEKHNKGEVTADDAHIQELYVASCPHCNAEGEAADSTEDAILELGDLHEDYVYCFECRKPIYRT